MFSIRLNYYIDNTTISITKFKPISIYKLKKIISIIKDVPIPNIKLVKNGSVINDDIIISEFFECNYFIISLPCNCINH